MPTVPHILRMRQRRRRKVDRNPQDQFGLSLAGILSILLALFAIGLTLIYTQLTRDLPSLVRIPQQIEPPDGLHLQPTRLYDRSGEQVVLTLQNPAIERRRYLYIDQDPQLSPNLITSTLVTIEPAFWTNPGFSIRGVFRQEQKTIAQSLVAELLLWDEPASIWNSMRERLLAAQITRNYGRPKVLEWYLNSAYYGHRAYGADAAAQVYLGKSASELNLAEAALLASVADNPILNPFDTPQDARDRQSDVIENMLQRGLISSKQAREAQRFELDFQEPVLDEGNPAPAYTNLVLEQLAISMDPTRLERGGFKVRTSLDFDLQTQANCVVETQISRLRDEPQTQTGTGDNICEAARLLPNLPRTARDLSQSTTGHLVAMDPSTGHILAMVGEPTPGKDPAHFPGNPPGTLLTPFVYLTAFTRGFSPANLVWDIPSELSLQGPFHGPMRLRTALANDYLTPAIQILNQIGRENVQETMRQLGISILSGSSESALQEECPECWLLPGGGQVTLLDMVHAFSAFDNKGILVGESVEISQGEDIQPLQPITILNVTDLNGRQWIGDNEPVRRPVISAQLAYLLTHVLSDEAARWDSLGHPNPLEIGRPAAAKIGRILDQFNGWTVGYTPHIVVGVRIGEPQSKTKIDFVDRGENQITFGEVPAKVASGVWHAIIQYATRDLPPENWEVPPGLSFVEVCDPSGMLPSENCPTVVNEVFLSGNEPTHYDNLYQTHQINRETNRLATVFTPPELIEERVYLTIPPEATDWARQSGIPEPPRAFDVTYTPPTSPNTQITSPDMYAHINGLILIQGSANSEQFSSYRLQVGRGLNPQEWLQISDDIQEPVENGTLGRWDTEGLDGLYAIQLVVLREDQRVETTTVQVTVDNQPPQISIPYPSDGDHFPYDIKNPITFQAQASDNVELNEVAFYLGQRLLARQTHPPFALPWRSRPGEFTLRVTATDVAGNESEDTVIFTVER